MQALPDRIINEREPPSVVNPAPLVLLDAFSMTDPSWVCRKPFALICLSGSSVCSVHHEKGYRRGGMRAEPGALLLCALLVLRGSYFACCKKRLVRLGICVSLVVQSVAGSALELALIPVKKLELRGMRESAIRAFGDLAIPAPSGSRA